MEKPERKSSMNVEDKVPLPRDDIVLSMCPRTGLWKAKIMHPTKNTWLNVGYYARHEDAIVACNKKKLECKSSECSSAEKTDAFFHIDIVKCLSTGVWVAKVKGPMEKKWSLVGSYVSREEAEDACAKKKLECAPASVQEVYDSFHAYNADSYVLDSQNTDGSPSQQGNNTDGSQDTDVETSKQMAVTETKVPTLAASEGSDEESSEQWFL